MFLEAKKKLKSNKGASLAAALLFFVFMAVTGSVILAAAASGMGTIKDQDKGNQERYALSSAADLIINAYADKDAFSLLPENDQTFTSEEVTYYISEDGTKYSDDDMTKVFNPHDDVKWPELPESKKLAQNMKNIRNQPADKIFKVYWDEVKDNWDEDTSPYWTDIIKNEKEEYSFDIEPGSDWIKNAVNYTVTAGYKEEHNLNIKVSLSLKNNKVNTYTVTIPFRDDAQIIYGKTPDSTEEYQVKYDYTDENGDAHTTGWIIADTASIPEGAYDVTAAYRTKVTQKRTIKFQNFKWKSADQASITTLKEDSNEQDAE